GTPTPAAPAPAGQPDPAPAPATPANPAPQPAPAAPAAFSPEATAKIQELERKLASENGSRQLAGLAASAGLKTPEDIAKAQRALQMVSQFESANIDPSGLLSTLGGNAANQPETPQPLTPESVEATVRKAIVGVQSESEHNTAWNTAEQTLDAKIAELTGDNTAAKSFIESRLTQEVMGMITAYPQGHPLEGKNAPVTTAQIEQAAAKVQQEWSTIIGASNATNPAVNPAAAVLNGGVPANNGGGLQSATGGDGVSGAGSVPHYKQTKDQRDALGNQFLAAAAAQSSGAFTMMAPQGT
ncbi:MAG: hypothetical protein GY851_34465, partial [bacterium]|nr:hypothetical protein [bacterium]